MKPLYTFLLFLLLFPLMLRAQRWEPTYGPQRGGVSSMTKISGTYYLAGCWGVYTSTNASMWQRIPDLSYAHDIVGFGSKIFVASNQVHISSDGINWTQTDSIGNYITKFIVDGAYIYAMED